MHARQKLTHAAITPIGTMPIGTTLSSNPGSLRSFNSKIQRAVALGIIPRSKDNFPGMGDFCGYAVGAWGNLCQAELP